jgi:hypothetical protein
MEELLDSLWLKTEVLIHHVKGLLDVVFAPLGSLGPAVAVFVIAFLTVCLTKFLSKRIKTKRFIELEKEFFHWHGIRKEALACGDSEKGRLLAKNIDMAKLNKVYYDYFLEGLLLGIFTRVLPIVLSLAYVNEAYRPENLMALFGRDHIFSLGASSAQAVKVGAGFWFVSSILLVYIGWFIAQSLYSKYVTKKGTKPDGENYSAATLPR